MFSWLKSFFTRSRTAEGGYDTFHVARRLIYRYSDGTKLVQADPIILYRKLMSVYNDIDANNTLARSQSKNAAKGQEAVVKYIRQVFDVKPFEEGGLTETETTALLDHFLIYCDEVKKNSGIGPNSATTTPADTSSSTPSSDSASSAEPSPPTKSSPSGSSESGDSTGTPTSSPSGPESPSEISPPESNSSAP